MVEKKRLPIFFIVLIIVSIIEASIVLYANLEKPSQKTATSSKKVAIHLCYAKPVTCKKEQKQEPKPVKKTEPKVEPKPPKSKPKPKLKPKPKQKLKSKLKPKPKPKPVQKKVVKQSESAQKSKHRNIPSTPKKSAPSAQKADRAKIDRIKSAYLKEVHQLIEENKYYPRRAKRMHRSGVVEIEFTILKDGKISNINILKGCKYSILNRAAKKTLGKIGTFQPLPNAFESDSLTLRVPINYILKH